MNYPRFVEYLWLDGSSSSQRICSRMRVLNLPKEPALSDIADWRFEQAYSGLHHCGGILRPVRVYPDPLREPGDFIVLCELLDSGGNTHEFNQRALMRAALGAAGDDIVPWLGCTQRYMLSHYGQLSVSSDTVYQATPEGIHRYAVGCENVSGREVAEAHARACVRAGIPFGGISALGGNGLWEFQVGDRDIVEEAHDALVVADDILLSRYLLKRVGEHFGVRISFNSTPGHDEKNNTETIMCFSTAYTRDPRCGLTAIRAIVSTLESSAGGSRPAQTNIPYHIIQQGHGYFDYFPDVNTTSYQIAIILISAVSGTAARNIDSHLLKA